MFYNQVFPNLISINLLHQFFMETYFIFMLLRLADDNKALD